MTDILKLPISLLALGDEVRALKNYCANGLITPEEAEERLADWELSYPPGWYDIELLVSARRFGHTARTVDERSLGFLEAAQ